MKNETYPLVDVVAALYAAEEFQAKLVYKIDPKFNTYERKPSDGFWVNGKFNEDGERESVQVPAIRDYAKATIGTGNKWTDPNACEVVVTAEHRDLAEKAIATITNKVMMDVLVGKTVNGFIGNLSKLLELSEVADRDFGLLSYVPKTARQYQETAAIDEKKAEYMSSKPVGAVGDKVFLEVTLFNARAMPKYESILYEGHDANGNLISFFKNEASKVQFQTGNTYKINGKVKHVGENDYAYGAIVNTLNYVRLEK